MRITHHLDETTILALAGGTITETLGVVAASHVWWCQHCRKAMDAARAIKGGVLGRTEGGSAAPSDTSDDPAGLAESMGIPAPVVASLGGSSLGDIKWRWAAPGLGIRMLWSRRAGAGRLFLMRIAPGRTVPRHGHGGAELTLVLRGSYTDRLGRFAIGDVADLDARIEHRPRVDGGAECICLVAAERPTRFHSVIMRMLQPFVSI